MNEIEEIFSDDIEIKNVCMDIKISQAWCEMVIKCSEHHIAHQEPYTQPELMEEVRQRLIHNVGLHGMDSGYLDAIERIHSEINLWEPGVRL